MRTRDPGASQIVLRILLAPADRLIAVLQFKLLHGGLNSGAGWRPEEINFNNLLQLSPQPRHVRLSYVSSRSLTELLQFLFQRLVVARPSVVEHLFKLTILELIK